jgi:hypothetical protein
MWVIIPFLIIAFVYISIPVEARYVFPTPFADEVWFLMQSFNFAKTGSLYAPQLNEETTILWMQPGYQIVMSLAYIIDPNIDLFTIRLISLSLVIALWFFVFMLTKYLIQNFWIIIVLIIVSQKHTFILLSNIARMESLILFTSILSVWLMSRNKYSWGLVLAFLLPLIHLNGFYLALGLTLYWISSVSWPINFERKYWLPALIVGLSWIIYLNFILINYETFIKHTIFQFERKAGSFDFGFIFDIRSIFNLLFYSSGIFWLKKIPNNKRALYFLGLGCLPIFYSGKELLYTTYFDLSLDFKLLVQN